MNVIIRSICRKISIERYNFFKVQDSLARWCWLARIMSGRSHIVSIIRGDDSGSEKKVDEKLLLLSLS